MKVFFSIFKLLVVHRLELRRNPSEKAPRYLCLKMPSFLFLANETKNADHLRALPLGSFLRYKV